MAGGSVSADFAAKIKSLSDDSLNDEITFSLSVAVGAGVSVGAEVSQVLMAGVGASASVDRTLELEVTIPRKHAVRGDIFLDEYVKQGTLADGLADVFIPYFGDSPWGNVLAGSKQFFGVLGLLDIFDVTRKDTPLGLLHAAVREFGGTVTVKAGFGSVL